jgi:hypothetical protein
VILYLDKHDEPVAVAPEWLFMAGQSLAPAGNEDATITFGDESFHQQAQHRQELELIAIEDRTYVYAGAPPNAASH